MTLPHTVDMSQQRPLSHPRDTGCLGIRSVCAIANEGMHRTTLDGLNQT